MNVLQKKSNHLIFLLIVFLLAFSARVYRLSQKEAFHVDEGMTVAISLYNDYMYSGNYEFNRPYTGEELKKISLANDDGLPGALLDIKNLWRDNRDPPQTNLYYSFFRLSLIGQTKGEIKPIIARAGALNLLFFTVSFFVFYLLMQKIFPGSKFIQIASTAAAFLSSASLNNTVFLRPYQMQEMIFIIFVFFLIKILEREKDIFAERKIIFIRNLVLLSLLAAITLLTGYYAIIFIGLCGLYVIYAKIKAKRYKDIMFFALIFCLALVFARLLFPNYFNGFSSYRGTETIQTVFEYARENIQLSLTTFFSLLNSHFFTYPVIIVCALCVALLVFFRQKPRFNEHGLFIFIISILYQIIILILAPYKVLRYVMPVYPFLAVLPFILIDSLKEKSKWLPKAAAALICVLFLGVAFNEDKIEHLYRNKHDEYIFTEYKDTPVFIWNTEMWKYPNLIPYLEDEQKYIFVERSEDVLLYQPDEFIFVVENKRELTQWLVFYDYDLVQTHFTDTGEPENEQHFIDKYFKIMRFKIKDGIRF